MLVVTYGTVQNLRKTTQVQEEECSIVNVYNVLFYNEWESKDI
jgi:hypothetical protein